MKAAIYNPYLDTLGGGERYTAGVILALLREKYKVDIEWPDPQIIEKLEARFGLNLKGVRTVDSIDRGDSYDVCFWVSDGSIPTLKSRNNILHFQVPFRKVNGNTLINKMKLFRIKHIVVNSNFTKEVIDKEYGVNCKVLYPPVSTGEFKAKRKQNKIAYIGRFSNLAQKKRQDVLIDVFKKFHRKNGNWKLVLAGGVEIGNKGMVSKLRKKAYGYPVEILESPTFSEIKDLLGTSKMFWSASGYGVDEIEKPKDVEHFGITVVEAMAAKAVPLVFNKGGHKEIVKHGENGYLWSRKDELLELSIDLAKNSKMMSAMSQNACNDSHEYSEQNFESELVKLL